MLSGGAWSFGTLLTPAETYAFGRGDTVTLPVAQRAWPMQCEVPAALLILTGALHIVTRPVQLIEEQDHILRWFQRFDTGRTEMADTSDQQQR